MLGVLVYEYFVVLGLYFFFVFSYYLMLWFNGMDFRKEGESLFSLKEFMDNVGLQYLCMALFILFIWWVVFWGLKYWELKYWLLLYLFGLFFFVLVGWKGYYWLVEQLGFGYLGGWGQVWDIYILVLFYFIQFGIFYGYEYYCNNQCNFQFKVVFSEVVLKSELVVFKVQFNFYFLYNMFNVISVFVLLEQEQMWEMIV